MKHKKKISVIVPIYNVEKYLEKAITSIVFQTYDNLEIILVNDGSTDGCPKLCDEVSEKYTRIKVIHKTNGGLSSARNAGLEVATGELIYFIDSDDYIHPNMLEDMMNLMEMYEADIVECGFKKIIDNQPYEVCKNANLTFYGPKQAIESLIEWRKCVPMVWNKIYKKEVIGDLRFEEGKINEDEFFTYKVLFNAKKIVHTDQKYYYYRQRPNSIMKEPISIKRINALDAQLERLEFINTNYPDLLQKTAQAYFHQCLDLLKQTILFNTVESEKKKIELCIIDRLIAMDKYVERNNYNKNIIKNLKAIKFNKNVYIKLREIKFKIERNRKLHDRLKKVVNSCKFVIKKPNEIRNRMLTKKNIDKFKSYKDKYNGKRCFIIGNGPSLTIRDLELLKNEITFAANKIYLAFEETDWRPTYYCIQDGVMLHECFDEINQIKGCTKFISDSEMKKYNRNIKDCINFHLNTERYAPNLPKFSEEVEKQIYEGFTVTYGEIQLAAYMGFKEIYLLGVDFNYSIKQDEHGEIIKDENVKDYFLDNYIDDKEKRNTPNLVNSYLAYQAAEKYTRSKGIKVFNATRGGKLDVFERVDFDKVIELK